MINFSDKVLSDEEQELFVESAKKHKEDEIINKMDKVELGKIKEKIENKEIRFQEELKK